MRPQALERQFAAWVERIGDLLLRPEPHFPIREILDELDSTFQSSVGWNWRDPDGSGGAELRDPVPGWQAPDELEYWATEGLRRHPLVRWFAVTGDPTAMTMDQVPREVASPFSFADVRDHLRPFSLEQELSIPYRLDGPMFRAFVVAKSGRDFHPEQLILARRIQPLLVLFDRQCAVLGPWRGMEEGEGQVAQDAGRVGLTGREVAVLRLLAEGGTAAAIGHHLGISPKTVQVHLNHVYAKLGVHDRLLAVSVARELNLLPPQATSYDGLPRSSSRVHDQWAGSATHKDLALRVAEWPAPGRGG